MSPQEILHALEEHKTKSYSGRGMYRKICFSVTGEQRTIQEDIMNVVYDDKDSDNFEETLESAKELLSTYNIDTMGKLDIVMYWSNMNWESSNENED